MKRTAIICAPWQSVERRYLAAAHDAGLLLLAAPSEAGALAFMRADADAIGIVWTRCGADARDLLAKTRRSGILNLIIVMMHGDGAPEELAVARAMALMAGADDCQPSDADIAEIAARLKALMQRGDWNDHLHIKMPGAMYQHERQEIVPVEGQRIHLTPGEAALLTALARRPGQTLSKLQIMDALYGGTDEPDIKIVDVWVNKLRRKIERATGGLDCIVTEWGRGYRFDGAGYRPAYHAHDGARRRMPA